MCGHAYRNVYVHVHRHMYRNVYRHVHTHVYRHVYAHLYTLVWGHVYTHVYAHVYAHVCGHVSRHVYPHDTHVYRHRFAIWTRRKNDPRSGLKLTMQYFGNYTARIEELMVQPSPRKPFFFYGWIPDPSADLNWI